MENSWIIKKTEKGNIYYYNEKSNKFHWQNPFQKINKCKILKGLNWVNNSCYIDSCLHALLVNSNNFVDKYILNVNLKNYPKKKCGNNIKDDIKNRQKIQKELKKITLYIRSGFLESYNADNLRENLKLCKTNEDWWTNYPRDPGEFIGYLLDLFPTDKSVKIIDNYYTNELKRVNLQDQIVLKSDSIIENKASIIQTISPDTFIKNGNCNIDKYLYDIDDTILTPSVNPKTGVKTDNFFQGPNNTKYNRKIKIFRLLDSPYIIFNIIRKHPITRQFICNVNVNPLEKITLFSGRILYLSSVISFVNNNHYICYFICNNKWYRYNDILDNKNNIKIIGNFKDLLEETPNVKNNGILYFYTNN
jgi:hypothetical protein